MTSAIAPWLEELARPPFRDESKSHEPDIVARRRRDALRVFESSLPAVYRWARLGHPLLAERVKLATIPSEPPSAQRVVFMGPAGAGKTSLAVALLRAMLERELAHATLSSDDDAERIARRYRFAHTHRIGVAYLGGLEGAAELRAAIRAPLLLLDDVGAESTVPSDAVPEVIAERHAEERATWITTGLSPKEIAERYGGGVARRVMENAAVLRMARS